MTGAGDHEKPGVAHLPEEGLWLRAVEIRGDEFPEHGGYPFDIGALQGRQHLTLRGAVSFFVGENGSGKSTLIEAIARRCGLHIWHETKRGVTPRAGRPAAPSIPPAGRLSQHVRVTLGDHQVRGGIFTAESFRQWAEFLDDLTTVDPGQAKYHGGTDLTLRSHGEGLIAYFRGRYQIPGLYFLDEPEAALSPATQLEFLRMLAEYRQRGHAQFILATHSPILMALPGAQVFSFSDAGIEETSYEQTAHYRLYRDFMADPARFF
jgi:predicted ATPase